MRGPALLLLLSSAAFADVELAVVRIVTVPEQVAVSVDGKLAGLSPREESLAPGVHTLTAERAGVVTSETISLAPGERRAVTLTLTPLVKAPPAFPLAGVLTFAGGAVALASGLLLRLPAEAAARKVSLLFERGGGWDGAAQALERDGVNAQAWSWALTTIGGALMVSGVAVAVIQLLTPRPPALVFVPVAGGGVVAGGFSW